LKPSEEDGDTSDGEVNVEDDLPYGTAFEVNNAMVKMIVNLEDKGDLDWLPFAERRKLEMKKKGD
jgi:hypothetical protein